MAVGDASIDIALENGFVHAMPDALVVHDDQGRIVFVNEACESLFRYARGELLGQAIEVLIPEQRRDVHVHARTRFAGAPVSRPMGKGAILAGRCKDGTDIPVDVALGAIRAASGMLFMAVVRDATPRKEAEARIGESERRYRELFESAPDGIIIANRELRLTDVNEAACRISGFTREELLGRSMSELVTPEERALQTVSIQRIAANGADLSEWQLRRKDGTDIAVELSTNTLPDGQLRAFVRDVSERKCVIDRLRRSEEGLARAQRVAKIGSFDWDVRAQTASRSTELCAIFGLGPEAEKGPPWLLTSMYHPDDSERAKAAVRTAEHDGLPYRIEHRIVRRDGAVRVVLHQGEAVRDDDGVARVVGTMLDITDRARIERERAETLQQLQAVLDQSPVGLILVRGTENPKVEINARGQQLVGRPLESLPQIPEVFVTPDDHAELPSDNDPASRALRGERFDALDLCVRIADGAIVPVSVSGAPIVDASGATQGAVVALQDVSAAKELERLRIEWASIVAHDLRQPLNGIALHAAVIARALARTPSPPSVALQATDTIARSTARLSRMISDLLDLSQLEARRVILSRRPTDVVALAQGLIDGMRLGEGAPPFELRVDEPIPLLSVDPDRIAQVIENLLTNAVKYGTKGASIDVAITADSDNVFVTVANDGPGIAPRELGTLFKRFNRTEDAQLGASKGIGLGLYICHELVAAHGGEITVESVRGGRTAFRFTLPVKASGLHRVAVSV